MNAETITIECEEDGFYMVVKHDPPDVLSVRTNTRYRITDPIALYETVCETIGDWREEGLRARRTAPVPSYDPSKAYDPWSTKHPGFHGALSGVWDNREGK